MEQRSLLISEKNQIHLDSQRLNELLFSAFGLLLDDEDSILANVIPKISQNKIDKLRGQITEFQSSTMNLVRLRQRIEGLKDESSIKDALQACYKIENQLKTLYIKILENLKKLLSINFIEECKNVEGKRTQYFQYKILNFITFDSKHSQFKNLYGVVNALLESGIYLHKLMENSEDAKQKILVEIGNIYANAEKTKGRDLKQDLTELIAKIKSLQADTMFGKKITDESAMKKILFEHHAEKMMNALIAPLAKVSEEHELPSFILSPSAVLSPPTSPPTSPVGTRTANPLKTTGKK